MYASIHIRRATALRAQYLHVCDMQQPNRQHAQYDKRWRIYKKHLQEAIQNDGARSAQYHILLGDCKASPLTHPPSESTTDELAEGYW